MVPPTDVGDDALRRHRAAFDDLVTRAERSLQRGRLRRAAWHAASAAETAWRHHPGLFASARLEEAVSGISRRVNGGGSGPATLTGTRPPARVLHVLTSAHATGGHSRLAWRWITQDAGRAHSVALGRSGPTPEPLAAAVAGTGGRVHALEGGVLERARGLRALALDHDVVVLHVDPADVVPGIAFAAAGERPAVVLMNHACHVFWTGTHVADLVAHGRAIGIEHSVARRGVARGRTALLPVPHEPPPSTPHRSAARAALGLGADDVLVLTMGHPSKFAFTRPAPADVDFLDLVLPIVQRHGNVRLAAVGPVLDGRWAAAGAATGGRVDALGTVADPAAYLAAADVFLDSFPVFSPTAVYESGGRGTPAVAYAPRPDQLGMLQTHTLGIDDASLRTAAVDEYRATLEALVMDGSRRRSEGGALARAIAAGHAPDRFAAAVAGLYDAIPDVAVEARGGPTQHEATALDRTLARVGPEPFGPGARVTILARRAADTNPAIGPMATAVIGLRRVASATGRARIRRRLTARR